MRQIAAALAVLVLAACSEGGDPVQMALRDASAERHAAAVSDGTVSGPPAPAVPAAAGNEGDAAYVAGMIDHHRAAMKMAVDALARSEDPEIRRVAQAEIDTRTRAIAELQSWRPAG